jgi:type IV pilus assembly protein PilW
MQDNGRYAVEQLGRDLSMAGYLGQFAGGDWSIPAAANLPAGLTCGAGVNVYDDLSVDPGNPVDWLFAVWPRSGLSDGFSPEDAAIAVDDNSAGAGKLFGCVPVPSYAPDSDVVSIKRVIGTPLTPGDLPAGDRVYVGRRGADAFMARGSAMPAYSDPPVSPLDRANPAADQVTERDYLYSPRIYYVREVDLPDDDLDPFPRLCRRVLAAGPALAEECIAEGVENFQIQFGLDLTGDGTANAYVSGLESTPAAGGPPESALVVSARITVLVRSLRPDPTYVNDKVYDLGDPGLGTLGPFNDNFYRRVFSSTVMVRNVRNLERLGF